jgi:lysophospholipase L1-like esterase
MTAPCLILGDSIAVGAAHFAPACEVVATSGINSADWRSRHLAAMPSARVVVISLGANDTGDVQTYLNLRAIRIKAAESADAVIWLLPPIHDAKRHAVRELAADFGDTVIDVRAGALAADKVHPTPAHYRQIATTILESQ